MNIRVSELKGTEKVVKRNHGFMPSNPHKLDVVLKDAYDLAMSEVIARHYPQGLFAVADLTPEIDGNTIHQKIKCSGRHLKLENRDGQMVPVEDSSMPDREFEIELELSDVEAKALSIRSTEEGTGFLLKAIKLCNFLSYGDSEKDEPLQMRALNVIIGSNGAGKSNLLEAISLLNAASSDILSVIREGGGVGDWLWKGNEGGGSVAKIDVEINTAKMLRPLRYVFSFTEEAQRFSLVDERVELAQPLGACEKPYLFYAFSNGNPVLNINGEKRRLQHEQVDFGASILSQRKDPSAYPELTNLGKLFSQIRVYREWSFGRYTPPRIPQKADLPTDFLLPGAQNLGLILNTFQLKPTVKKRFLDALHALYDSITDYHVQIEGGTVQLFLQEGGRMIPATRLSDGTLRYICLLAILCHPNPPPLVCIEEPELGLHPDVMSTLADLLREASTRCQLVVTTHSDYLVDAFHDTPEDVIVAEKTTEGTTLKRLSAEKLKPWLEKYRLCDLWISGEIGGTRW